MKGLMQLLRTAVRYSTSRKIGSIWEKTSYLRSWLGGICSHLLSAKRKSTYNEGEFEGRNINVAFRSSTSTLWSKCTSSGVKRNLFTENSPKVDIKEPFKEEPRMSLHIKWAFGLFSNYLSIIYPTFYPLFLKGTFELLSTLSSVLSLNTLSIVSLQKCIQQTKFQIETKFPTRFPWLCRGSRRWRRRPHGWSTSSEPSLLSWWTTFHLQYSKKPTCVASIHGNEFASALPKYFSEQRGGRLKVLPLYLKSLQYCNLCLLLLTSPHRRSQRSSQVDHLSWWKSSTIFVFFRSLQKSSTIFFVRPWRKSRSTWLKYNFFVLSWWRSGTFFSSELTEALFLQWDVWVGGSSSGNKKKSN